MKFYNQNSIILSEIIVIIQFLLFQQGEFREKRWLITHYSSQSAVKIAKFRHII